jgi:ribonucleoside-diphosphate reductase alpha chain
VPAVFLVVNAALLTRNVGVRTRVPDEAPVSDITRSLADSRKRLPNRHASEIFELKAGGLRYTASVSRFPDGRVSELFLNNQKSNSAADTNARDSAIAFSFAVQHGADAEAIRRALSRDAQGRALGPLGVALDIIARG